MKETALYPPIKQFFESLGFEVKAEIGPADVMAVRGTEPPVFVELKTRFSLALVHQGIARQKLSDQVYLAVPQMKARGRAQAVDLCRRLGLGLIELRGAGVLPLTDPAPFQPRKSPRKAAQLLREFAARRGDPNMGGATGRRMTAYRQDAEACAAWLAAHGAARGAEVAKGAGVARATRLMADNHYGWFVRVARGVYDLSEAGATRAPNKAEPTRM